FDAGRFGEAAREYQAAYALSPRPSLLYNTGLALQKQGELAAALTFYRRFIEEAPADPAAALARQESEKIEKTLAAARAPTPPVPVAPPPAELPPPPATTSPPPSVVAVEAAPSSRPGRTLRVAGLASAAVGVVCAALAVKYGLDASDASDRV